MPPSESCASNDQAPTESWTQPKRQAFDVRGVSRFTNVDSSRNNSVTTDYTPSRSHSNSVPGSGPMTNSSTADSTPNVPTPESIRQFDPEKFFEDMSLPGSGIDVTMNMGQGMGDDGVEFFTEMLGVHLNGN
jgi:hypothetical protein